jgi:hypothetical protein
MWYLRYRRIMKCNGRKNFFRFFAYLALQRVPDVLHGYLVQTRNFLVRPLNLIFRRPCADDMPARPR